MTKVNRPPVSLSKITTLMSRPERADRIAVIVGTVVDDPRLYTVPKLTVSFLKMFQIHYSLQCLI